jgi:signal transduction histidine kinase
MKAYRDLGIQRKMQVMTLLICGAVLLVAIAALFSFQVLNFRSNFQRDGLNLAFIIADNGASAMALKDREAANEAIGTLEFEPNVVSASLVLPDRTLLARYGKLEDNASLSKFPNHRAAEFAGGDLLVMQPVRFKGKEWVGTLYLRMNYQGTFEELIRFYTQVITVIAIIATGLGLFLSSRLGRTITGPVLQLAKTTQVVGEKKDYSVRAIVGDRGDELGRLTESFNEMLARIQSQDAALNLSQQKMEALINSVDGIVWERTPVTFRFTFISRQSETLLGYMPSAWVEQPDFWASKLHPQDAKALQIGRDLAAKGLPYSFEYRLQAADDRTVWIRESGMVVKEKGRPVAVRGIMQDITRLKRDAEELDKLNRQLIDTSRQAGMADVATGVLHNVGNVLNSVSVSATLVRERLRRSKVVNLQRATSLLRNKNGQLGDYLTNDPKGKLLPEYFGTVADQLSAEQGELITEVDSMGQNIEHIKEIVAMQQNYARVSGAYEYLSVPELVEDAVRMNLAAFERHHIHVIRDFAENLPKVCVDRHKFLQILINLLRNAKHALEEMEEEERRITVHASLVSADQVKLVVRDNGVGIAKENLTKIFSHGFTTKKDGHGFGLHSGALAAKEMGGSLTGHSEGPNQGAEFTLLLSTISPDRRVPEPQTQGAE